VEIKRLRTADDEIYRFQGANTAEHSLEVHLQLHTE
jgi:hypothetical protein